MHSISNWIDLHGVDCNGLQDLVAAYRSGKLHPIPAMNFESSYKSITCIPARRNKALADIVVPVTLPPETYPFFC